MIPVPLSLLFPRAKGRLRQEWFWAKAPSPPRVHWGCALEAAHSGFGGIVKNSLISYSLDQKC